MFLVNPTTEAGIEQAIKLLEFYGVAYRTEERSGLLPRLITSDNNDPDDLRLAEAAIQWQFHQEHIRLCDVCKAKIEATGEGEDTCGHLQFGRLIQAAF